MKLDEREESPEGGGEATPAPGAEGVFALYGMPGFLVRRAKQKSTALFTEACSAQGITPPQYAVLRVLQALPGLDQGEIADHAVLDEATTAGILDRLHRRALIDRRRSGRRRIAFLSSSGAVLLDELAPQVAGAQAALLAPLNAREQQQLKRLLSKMTGTANAYHRPRRRRPRRFRASA